MTTERQDDDQRIKQLLQEFFGEFLALFHPQWAARLDAERIVWRDKEVFLDPPQGRRRTLDLAGEAPIRPEAGPPSDDSGGVCEIVLVVEIEGGESTQAIRPRIAESFFALRMRSGPRVLPIVLFLRRGLAGAGVEHVEDRLWDFSPLRVSFLYVGLAACDGEAAIRGENPLGWALAAFMKLPPGRKAALAAEAFRRIAESRLDDARKFLLGECLHAHVPLAPAEWIELEEATRSPGFEGVRAMNLTWHGQGLQQGRAEGRAEGEQGFVRKLLERKFGPLPAIAATALGKLSTPELLELADRAPTAKSLAELGLPEH